MREQEKSIGIRIKIRKYFFKSPHIEWLLQKELDKNLHSYFFKKWDIN